MQRAGWGFVPQPALSFRPAVCLRFLEDNTDNTDNRDNRDNRDNNSQVATSL